MGNQALLFLITLLGCYFALQEKPITMTSTTA